MLLAIVALSSACMQFVASAAARCVYRTSWEPCSAGLVLAAAVRRSVLLPEFLLNGMQPDNMQTITADKADTAPFR
jgi:hypothetical protein